MVKSVAALFLTLAVCRRAMSADAVRCDGLRCEYCANPLNVDLPHPRLSFILASAEKDQTQTGYEILVASSQQVLNADQGDLWDSGKVASDSTGQISYSGKTLGSNQSCFWKVRVWCGRDAPSSWSAPASWSMGLLNPKDWKGSWITGPIKKTVATPPVTTLPIFRKQFKIDRLPARAVIHICGLGQYELTLNGSKVGDAVLEPGWTDYRKTCLYQSYDVTSQLKVGANAMGVMLGNGMYSVQSSAGRYQKFSATMGPPQLIAQLELLFQDGSSQVICTDPTWKVTDGPITFSNIYGGEDHDARLELPHWDEPNADDSTWQMATVAKGPSGKLAGVSRSALPITVAGLLKSKLAAHPKVDAWVFDLGQNCAQLPLITVKGPSGALVRLTPGEVLSDDGSISQQSSGSPVYDTYTLKGDPNGETWSPRFSYTGFRYLQISGAVPAGKPNASHLPELIDLRGQFITGSAAFSGEFSCSDPLFNRINQIIRWAMRNNLMSVLTDCPHREKLGWLEQSHLVGPSLIYNFQIPALLTKICGDTSDAQLDNGLVPDIAPELTVFNGGFRDSPEWGSACVLLPWQLYQWYGDTEILDRQYWTMQRYVAYLGTRAKDNMLSHGLGDWYDLGPKEPGYAQLTPQSLTATAFYFRDIAILAQAAKLLGHDEDAVRYAGLATQVRDAFNHALYHADTHNYATGSQTANAIPLVFGLAPQADRQAIVDNIVRDIRSRDNGLTSGDIGYRYLLRALADGGRSDVIFDMNSRSDKPGYGMMIAKGATSLTEAWDARPGSSQDHFMLGHLMEWFYSDLAGIQQEADSVAFKKIRIKPTPVGDLKWASASFQSASGTIKSSWRIESNTFTLDVEIPPNTSAKIYFPAPYQFTHPDHRGKLNDDLSVTIGSGSHHFIASK